MLHWLGPMFDPALAGYWGHDAVDGRDAVALDVIGTHADKVDASRSLCSTRTRRLPCVAGSRGVRMYTGDDFNYPELIAGDAEGHSDALLGAFAAIAPVASAAFVRLAEGIAQRSSRSSRRRCRSHAHLPQSDPVLQDRHRLPRLPERLPGPFHHARGSGRCALDPHLAEAFRLADQAGLLLDPVRAAAR